MVGTPQPQMFFSLFWFVEELRDEREKSKSKGKEEFSNSLLLLPKADAFDT